MGAFMSAASTASSEVVTGPAAARIATDVAGEAGRAALLASVKASTAYINEAGRSRPHSEPSP